MIDISLEKNRNLYENYQDCLNFLKLVKINPKFYRPAEVDHLLGNSKKAREELGWKPEHTFDDLVKKMTWYDINSIS
jgi:GDP-D-mannose dehydratase